MTATYRKKNISKLYDRDFYLWIQETITLLRKGNFAAVDVENLIEEMEDIGKSQKQAVRSNSIVVLMHLLKYKYQPEKRSGSWRHTIREHRRRLREAFEDSPSLRNYFTEVFYKCYQNAIKEAADETELHLDTFPIEPAFTPEECLDEDFLPEL
ncbi:DUF29 domain-containing protein [Argonema antarcticum]|uniref:DUF29 domain-containing protein n=1 Tax=Argonema antarcticum TaxID=2942763 RepID=UPI0020117076|nr:DUF29 domain-containing protein [Argonema antarcticum]MCL1470971.1 DUF29 domain-containing protein [Argonema antarcticum A004/B2]